MRYDGFIKLVDHEKEMAMYDRKHGRSRSSDAKGKVKASERSLLDEDDVSSFCFMTRNLTTGYTIGRTTDVQHQGCESPYG